MAAGAFDQTGSEAAARSGARGIAWRRPTATASRSGSISKAADERLRRHRRVRCIRVKGSRGVPKSILYRQIPLARLLQSIDRCPLNRINGSGQPFEVSRPTLDDFRPLPHAVDNNATFSKQRRAPTKMQFQFTTQIPRV